MSAIFISHSSKDNAAAQELFSWLKSEGYRFAFLDLDPADGIPAGQKWKRELYDRLADCRALIILCSRDSMASNWCFAEMTYADALGKDIFPVKIAPCELQPLLMDRHVIDMTTDKAEGYARLRKGLRTAGLDPAEVVGTWDGSRPPYPGLMTFQKEDAAVFFGRDAGIRDSLDMLVRRKQFGGACLLVIVGASGSGKSSLVRAGVIPRLERDASWLLIGPFRPLNRPFDELAIALGDAFAVHGIERDWRVLRDQLYPAGMPAEPRILFDITRDLRSRAGKREAMPLVIIDQLEELLESGRSEAAGHFLSWLITVLRAADGQLLVLATLRSDFLAELQQQLGETLFETLNVRPFSVDDYVQIIEGPARVARLQLEPGLVQALIDDSRTQNALPLLAFTLGKLWETRGPENSFTLDQYRNRLGGLEKSVARAAEELLAQESPDPKGEKMLREALTSMVRIDEEGKYVKRAARWEELPEESHPMLERFVKARLLVSRSLRESDGREEQERVLEVAHEALFREWERLRNWLQDDAHRLRLQEGVRRAAREWESGKRDRQLLVHGGTRLQEVLALRMGRRFALEDTERLYLQACRRRESTRRWLRRGFMIFLLLVASVFLGLYLWANREQQIAQNRLADLHWVNGATARDRNHDLLKAGHHFMKAAALTVDPLHRRNAYWAGALLTRSVHLAAILDHGKPLAAVVFNRDESQVWSWSEDGTTRIWNSADGKLLRDWEQRGSPEKVVASPEGKWIVFQLTGGLIRIMDARTGEALIETEHVRSTPLFSYGENWALTWDDRGSVQMWEVETGRRAARLQQDYPVEGAAVSRNGKVLVAWGKDPKATIWAVQGPAKIAELQFESSLAGVLLSHDGSRLLAWGKNGSPWVRGGSSGESLVRLGAQQAAVSKLMGARFYAGDRRIVTWNYGGLGSAGTWDSQTGQELALLQHHSEIRRAILNSTESRILTCSDDGTARLWDSESGEEILRLNHGRSVRGAVFSGDENLILTWSDDTTAQLWDSRTGMPLGAPLKHAGAVRRARFSEDGKRLLTWDREGTARLWELQPNAPAVALGHPEPVLAAAYSQTRKGVTTLCSDGNLYSWSAAGEPLGAVMLGSDLLGAVFSPDRERVVTWSRDHMLQVRSARNGEALTPKLGHEESSQGVLGAAFSLDARLLLSWGGDRTARLWDAVTGERLLTLEHEDCVRGAVLASDASRIVTWSDDRGVQLWDREGRKVLPKQTYEYQVKGATLSRDAETMVVWGSDGGIRVLESATGRETAVFHHDAAVRGAAFSADERLMLSWGEDGTARLWGSGESDREITSSLKHDAAVAGASFSNDESRILTWSDDFTARVWDSRNGQALTIPLRHFSPVAGAVMYRLAEDEVITCGGMVQQGSGGKRAADDRLLTWSGNEAWMWDLKVDYCPLEGRALEGLPEPSTGTRLNQVDEIEILSAADWSESVDRLKSD